MARYANHPECKHSTSNSHWIKNALEVKEFDDSQDEWVEANKRLDLIMNLERSYSFRNTHLVIKELLQIDSWTPNDIEMLCEIALKNGQVKGVIKDIDVRGFFSRMLNSYDANVENEVVSKVRELIQP